MRKELKHQESISAIFLLLGIIFSSCSNINQLISDTNELQSINPTKTMTQAPESISSVQITLTEPVVEPYTTNCLNEVEDLPEIDDIEGKLIIQDSISNLNNYIYDLSTSSRIMLNAPYASIIVSPDHSMIAFPDDFYRKLIVSDTEGQEIVSYWTDPITPAQELVPVQWLDNQHILMFTSGMGEYPNYLAPYAAIFDIEAGKSEKIMMDFPGLNLNYNQEGANWYLGWFPGDSRLAISPDRQYIIYPAIEDSERYLVVWDKNSNEEVSRLPGIKPRHTEPQWAPAGNYFAAISMGDDPLFWPESEEVSGDEIFVFDHAGNFEQITAFGTESPGNISFLSWSPDGTQIAFWFDRYDVGEIHHLAGELFVIDLGTSTIQNTCVEGRREIYWSLDGKYLFINPSFAQDRISEYSVTIVNLEDLWAFDLIDNASVYGVINEEKERNN